eukprot:4314495-Ditylum_brightwellii.AAC.1
MDFISLKWMTKFLKSTIRNVNSAIPLYVSALNDSMWCSLPCAWPEPVVSILVSEAMTQPKYPIPSSAPPSVT